MNIYTTVENDTDFKLEVPKIIVDVGRQERKITNESQEGNVLNRRSKRVQLVQNNRKNAMKTSEETK